MADNFENCENHCYFMSLKSHFLLMVESTGTISIRLRPKNPFRTSQDYE